ncbi:16S rRNA (guanine(966)-N(2))-methyltransferase RsmD [bacterium]|nr:16S rRNA (guanine(966)-N(2))-methyltransferase RsmD [bacterium]
MRVCSGTASGVILKSPPGAGVRPTSAKVRQAIFSILSGKIGGSFVLDLYAGTGAMGIEALSRGAAEAVFVEISPRCLRTIKQNLELTKLSDKAIVIGGNAFGTIRQLGRQNRKFDIVIADPPYTAKNGRGKRLSLARKTLKSLVDSDILRPNSVVIVEHSGMENSLKATDDLKLVSARKYGGTSVSIFAPMQADRMR